MKAIKGPPMRTKRDRTGFRNGRLYGMTDTYVLH